MKIVKMVLCILLGLVFINAGLDKFFHYMPVPPLEPEILRVDEAFKAIKWLMPLVGFTELLGGLLILLPKTRTMGALILFPIFIGILIHTSMYAREALMIPLIAFLIELFILWDNRNQLKPIICTTKN